MKTPLPRALGGSRQVQLAVILAIIIVVLCVGLFESAEASSQVKGFVHSISSSSAKATGRCVPTSYHVPLSPTGPIVETWHELQELFETHPPLLNDEKAILVNNLQSPNIKHPLPTGVADASALRMIHQHLVARIPARPPPNLYNGLGIVMLAGQSRNEYAATSLGMLRLVGSRLPVELWFRDRASAKTGWCAQLVTEGVTCRFLSDYTTNFTQNLLYEEQQRAAVLLFSSFAHVLYLHSDTIPILNPDDTFGSQSYRDTALVTWPDFWQSSQSMYADFVTGASTEIAAQRIDYGTIDPTQLIWDKERQWKVSVT